MKKGFTIVEVSILFVIFLIVAFLVAPLSLDDTMQAKNTSRWRNVQLDFSNIFYSISAPDDIKQEHFIKTLKEVISNEVKGEIPQYRISYLNNSMPDNHSKFEKYYSTLSNATISVSLIENSNDKLRGYLMYDVNGKSSPNTWGKDVFGLKIYNDKLEPFCKEKSLKEQKQDCSRKGSGLCCSNYYLIGGSFD